jgi:hypothetical protein
MKSQYQHIVFSLSSFDSKKVSCPGSIQAQAANEQYYSALCFCSSLSHCQRAVAFLFATPTIIPTHLGVAN